MRQLAGLLSISLTVLGCQPERQPETASVVAGAVNSPRQLAVVEEIRIGSVSDPDIGFSRVGAVAVGPDRRMYVSELQDRHVRIYDAAGNLQRVVGRQGQGPGEFQWLSGFGLLGDTVWVVDTGNSRITLFNRDGDLVGTVRAPRISIERGSLLPWYLRPDRSWVSEGMLEVPMAGASFPRPELLFDASGALTDTLRNVEIVIPPFSVVIDSVSFPGEYLLRDDPLIAHDPGARTVIVRRAGATSNAPSAFSVTSISVSGDTVFDRSFEYRPISVDETYIDRVVENLLEGPQARLGAGRIERALRSALPRFHPPVTQIRFGEDGTIWLRRENAWETEARYWILEADGVVRGSVSIPVPRWDSLRGSGRSFRIMWSGTDEFVGMELDDLDVPWLIRYRYQ